MHGHALICTSLVRAHIRVHVFHTQACARARACTRARSRAYMHEPSRSISRSARQHASRLRPAACAARGPLLIFGASSRRRRCRSAQLGGVHGSLGLATAAGTTARLGSRLAVYVHAVTPARATAGLTMVSSRPSSIDDERAHPMTHCRTTALKETFALVDG